MFGFAAGVIALTAFATWRSRWIAKPCGGLLTPLSPTTS
jgi:hypothetical protein